MFRTTLLLSLTLAASTAFAADSAIVGLTSTGVRIEAQIVSASSASAPTVMVIGGMRGDQDSARAVTREVSRFEAAGSNRAIRLIAIPMANPGGAALAFPPTGAAYRENTEAHVLWRWIALQGPDLVLIAGEQDSGLAAALSQNAVAGIGKIPARRVAATETALTTALAQREIPRSEARQEIERRRQRSPREVANELGKVYGQEFNELTYIPGMGLVGRIRLGNVPEVQNIVAQWVDGPRAGTPGRPVSGNIAGYLVFGELAERTKDPRYVQMVKDAASVGFTETGEMKESMGSSNGMSDGVFMSIPILGKAAKLTGDRKYCDMALRHLRFMQAMDLRPDGLYRHSPTSEDTAWGRGNAFPAIGLALTLTDCATDHPAFAPMLQEFKKHIEKLAPFQDQFGMWHQVIDEPGSYAEFTATAMIGISMLRGVRNGWLDAATYQPRIDAAWRAVSTRISSTGELIDVCESTNKQPTFQDYLKREAIMGKDIRGGGMAILFSTELAGLQ